MQFDLVTKDDLQAFKKELLHEISAVMQKIMHASPSEPEGYKTKDVRRILGCSVNKIVSLRMLEKIRVKKIGGTLYYNKEDVRKLLEEGF